MMNCTKHPQFDRKYTINFITSVVEEEKFNIVIFFTSTDYKHSFYVPFMELFIGAQNEKPCGPFVPHLTLSQNLEIMKNKVILFSEKKNVKRNGFLLNYLNWEYDKEANKT